MEKKKSGSATMSGIISKFQRYSIIKNIAAKSSTMD